MSDTEQATNTTKKTYYRPLCTEDCGRKSKTMKPGKCRECNGDPIIKQKKYTHSMCTQCGKNNARLKGLCRRCSNGADIKLCEKCGINHVIRDGLCTACGSGGLKCTKCGIQKRRKDGLCGSCGGKRPICTICNKNIAVLQQMCKKCGANKIDICIIKGCEKQKVINGMCIRHAEEIPECKLCQYCKTIAYTSRKTKDGKKVKACARCFYYYHPDEGVPRRYMMKQHYFNDAIKEEYGDDFFIYNKTISGGCSKRRPDWFIDCNTHTVIIECDEEQHKDREDVCEYKRTAQLYEDLAERPMVLIRFNPDKYDGVRGCFAFSGDQINCYKSEFDKRFQILKDTIDKYTSMSDLGEEMIVIEKLFFNDKK
jgi:hypothetical protein